MGKGLSYLKNGGAGVNYCWNYGSSNFLLHFIEYRLDQLNNKHLKTTVNSKIWFFGNHDQRKYFINYGPLKFLWNWMETIYYWLIFSNFTNARYLVYWKCIIWAQYDLPTIDLVCEKVWFRINELPKMLFFKCLSFSFFQISNDYCQKSYGKTIVF